MKVLYSNYSTDITFRIANLVLNNTDISRGPTVSDKMLTFIGYLPFIADSDRLNSVTNKLPAC